jgi:hypothetical protein
MDLFDQARRQHATGLMSEATRTLAELLNLTRGLAKRHPEDLVHQQATASALYMLASIHLEASRPDAAIAALAECEEIYLQLGRAGFVDARPLVADVKMRRAAAMAVKGLGASAVTEADACVASYLELTGGALHEKRSRDLARVLARNSLILARFGDPDLAVGSADFAVRIYLAQRVGTGQFTIHEEDIGYLRQAAAQAALIHLRHGRLEDGLFVGQIAVQFGVPATAAEMVRQAAGSFETTKRLDTETKARIVAILQQQLPQLRVGNDRDTPRDDPLLSTTLSGALAATGQARGEELSRQLTRPALDRALMIPSQRSGPQIAPVHASQLAVTAVETLPTRPVAGIRIGLEAHYMFAAASSSGQSFALRYQFQDFGPDWARLLLACSAAFEARDDLMMALDLASWAGGVARQLMPLPVPGLAALARECVERHGHMLIATGDREAGEEALAAAATIT